MDVVDAIANAQTGAIAPFGRDVPVKPIVIKKMSVVKAAEPSAIEPKKP